MLQKQIAAQITNILPADNNYTEITCNLLLFIILHTQLLCYKKSWIIKRVINSIELDWPDWPVLSVCPVVEINAGR